MPILPRVALTTTVDAEAGTHARPAVFVYTSYVHALEQIGLAPVLITPAHSPGAIDALLAACCGLVLTGGEDIDPARYGERPSPALGSVLPARDDMEFRALQNAIERRMPIFGICRGCQVINVHFGGTLYQDLDTEAKVEIRLPHEQTEPWGKRSHSAIVEHGSKLHSVLGDDPLFINSYHHQAVKAVGNGLRVTARADDGMVEAIEHETYPWLIGVQWHPERQEAAAPATDPDRKLFLGFRSAVLAYSASTVGDREPSSTS